MKQKTIFWLGCALLLLALAALSPVALFAQTVLRLDGNDVIQVEAVTSDNANNLITGINANASGTFNWARVSKSGSSLADLATRSAGDLTTGTLPDARFPATLPALSGVNLTALNASNLAIGTVPTSRLYTTAAAYNITGGAFLDTWGAITRASGFDTFTATPSGLNLASLLTSALPPSRGGTGLTALSANIVSLLGAADYSAFRTQLSLVPGTDIQAYDIDLTRLASGDYGASVKAHGATDNGTSDDDTAAFAAAAVAGAGKVYVPPGTYLVKNLTLISNLEITGMSSGISILKTDADLPILRTQDDPVSNVRIRGIRLEGRNQNSPGVDGDIGISLSSTGALSDSLIEYCEFTKLNNGIKSGFDALLNSTIQRNTFTLISRVGIDLLAPRGVAVIHNDLNGDRAGVGNEVDTLVNIWIHESDTNGGTHNRIEWNHATNTVNENINVHSSYTSVSYNYASGVGAIVIEGTANTTTPTTPITANFLSVRGNWLDGVPLSVRPDPVYGDNALPPSNVVIEGNQSFNLAIGSYSMGVLGVSGSNRQTRVIFANNLTYNFNTASNPTAWYFEDVSNLSISGGRIDTVTGVDALGIQIKATGSGGVRNVLIHGVGISGVAGSSSSNPINLNSAAAGGIVYAQVIANPIDCGSATVTHAIWAENGGADYITDVTFMGNIVSGSAVTNTITASGARLVARNNFLNGAPIYPNLVGSYSINSTLGDITTWLAPPGTDILIKTQGSGARNIDLEPATTGSVRALGSGSAPALVAAGGAFSGSHFRGYDVTTNSTNKGFKFGVLPYNTAQSDVMAIYADITSTINALKYGGGTSTHQAATRHEFYAASAVNTVTGIHVGRISAAGWNIGTDASGTAVLRLKHGTAVLVSGTVTVSDTTVTANTRIFPDWMTEGGTAGVRMKVTRSAGVSFTLTAVDAAGATVTTDTSTIAYLLIEP